MEMMLEMNRLLEQERELFSDTITRNQFLSARPFKADASLVGNDYFDPVKAKILRMSENARNKVNKYLTSKGLRPVDLPAYLEIKDMPNVRWQLLSDEQKKYALPKGNTGAYYNTEADGITFYRAMVPGSRENKDLKNIYMQGIRTANELMQKYHELRKPLQKLMRFYATMIRTLNDPEKAEDMLVHEYGHKVAQERKNAYGENLNKQLMSAPLKKGDKRKAVEPVEGFNVNLTDDITGRESAEEGTTYYYFGKKMGYVLRKHGKTPADVLAGAYNDAGKEISHGYVSLN